MDKTPAKNLFRKTCRYACPVLGLLLLALLALSVWIVIESQRPEPGANMILIALVMLAIPINVLCIMLLTCTALAHRWLGRVEKSAYYMLGGAFLLIWGTLFLLG
ncbi:MAG: hypothetical protein AAGA29_03125 [Planctomycetota bacterium]